MSSASLSDARDARAPASDAALIESARSALVTNHFSHVWRALRRFGLSAADADDAAQQVFLTAVQRLHDIDPGRERAFLYGVAANAAFKAKRMIARRREDGADFETTVAASPDTEELVEQRRARELLDRILEGLEHDVRVVFVLHEIEELTAPEIAEALSVPLGTVASRLRRGREQFAKRLARIRAASGGRP